MKPHHALSVSLVVMAFVFAVVPHAQGQSGGSGAVQKSAFVYETAPFPSCHASTVAESKNGLVVAFFGGSDEGENDVGIWVCRLDNNAGGKWTAPVEVVNGVSPDGKRYPCWNPVLFQKPGRDGPLMLFYKVGPNPRQWWGMLVSSADGGKSWSKPQRLPDGFLGPIKNKPVLRPDGSLLCPSSTEDPEDDEWRVHLETLAPDGKWSKTPPLNDAKQFGVIQPSVLTHPDDTLQIVCRSRQGKVAEAWSTDGGKTWQPMKLIDALPNPNSGLDAVTLKDGRHVLVYNHTPRGRTPLSVAVSRDGKAWATLATLATEPGEYSYPAVIQSGDGKVHVTYTWKRQRIKHAVVNP